MKSVILFFSLFTSTLLFGQQSQNITIDVNGTNRQFILYVPNIYDASNPAPLLFCFHGYGSSASTNYAYTKFRDIADTAGFVLIHPQGSTDAFGTPHFNVGWGTSNVDDVAFTEAMIDYAEGNYNINSNRIYSTGMSNGGFMSYHLACNLSEKIAAVASVTGSMSPSTFNNCNPSHPTPALQIHGTSDGTVPYEGDPLFTKGIDDVINYWVTYNNCDPLASVTPIPDINAGDNTTVDHFVHGDGDNGVSVELFKVYDGDHDWPGAFGNLDIDASAEIWKFFMQFDLNGSMTSTYELYNEIDFEVYPNPVSNEVQLSTNTFDNQRYTICGLNGKTLVTGVLSGPITAIDLSKVSAGMYLIKIGASSMKISVR
jgi:polyhydroxybutyrate depolymerase